jgi:hypothetical protein
LGCLVELVSVAGVSAGCWIYRHNLKHRQPSRWTLGNHDRLPTFGKGYRAGQ